MVNCLFAGLKNTFCYFSLDGPLFEVKLFNDYGYPPLQSRTHQAWDSTNATSNYNQTSSDTTHLPFLPLTSSHQEPDYNYSSTITSLPYPPSQVPSQSYVDSRAMVSFSYLFNYVSIQGWRLKQQLAPCVNNLDTVLCQKLLFHCVVLWIKGLSCFQSAQEVLDVGRVDSTEFDNGKPL